MKNIFKLSFLLQSRKKSIIFNILFIAISILIVLGVNTYSDSAINYMNNDVYNSVFFKSLEVFTSEYDNVEEIKKELESLENITVVSNFYSYSDILQTKEFVNEKMDGMVNLYVASNKSLPNVTFGTDFPDEEGNYLICPETLYATSDKDSLKTISTKYAINMKEYLNKEIEFTYKSNLDNYDFEDTFIVVGLYESNGYLDSNICYTQNSSLENIISNKYSDEINKETGESNLIYQTGLFVQVDDLNNMEKVKTELSSLGYNYEENAIIITSYFENIQNVAQKVSVITLIITLVVLLVVSIKQFNDDKNTYILFKYLGYHKKSIYLISFVSNLIQFVVSILISMLIFGIVYIIFNIILNYYPYILNNWRVCVNYSSIISVLIITMLALILSSMINIFKIDDIEETK